MTSSGENPTFTLYEVFFEGVPKLVKKWADVFKEKLEPQDRMQVACVPFGPFDTPFH